MEQVIPANMRVGSSKIRCNYRSIGPLTSSDQTILWIRLSNRTWRKDVVQTKIIIADCGGIDVIPKLLLEQEGMHATVVYSTLQVRRHLYRSRYDLIIIDAIRSPEEAISFCRQVRTNDNVPILLIVPPGNQDVIVSALGSGADDCMSPPLPSAEFIARVKNLFRRASYLQSPSRQENTILVFAGFRLSVRERLLSDSDGNIIELTSTEFDLLLAFCRNPGRLMKREDLLALTHAGLAGPIARSVDVHISRLRPKIEQDPQRPRLLRTVRLGGYVFTADVAFETAHEHRCSCAAGPSCRC